MSAPPVPHRKPLVFDYSLGETLDLEAAELVRSNAVGKAVVPPTTEQKYLFDTQGWLVIPAVLGPDEIEEMRAFCHRLHSDPESLPEHQRNTVAGPLEELTDHPVIVGFMNEFLAHPRLSSPNCYGFRMEKSSLCVRRAGEGGFVAHNGNGLWRLQGDSHNYRCIPGKAQSSLTCIVWELNEVEEGCGGTLFINGSHKAAYPAPDSVRDATSPLWSTYSCPPGSLLIFAEATSHSTALWTSEERDRMAIFSRYNYVDSKWHNWDPPAELVASMPPMRQTLFRPVHWEGNLVDPV